MHPKERAEVHGGPGVAVVAAVSQAHAHAQRQPNRGSAQVENGEILDNFLYSMQRQWFVLMCCPIINFQEELDALKARLEKVEKEKNEYKVAAEKFESRVRSFIA